MRSLNSKPFISAVLWTIVLLGAFLLLTGRFFLIGFSTDKSNISLMILVFFVIGLFTLMRRALDLDKEWSFFLKVQKSLEIPEPDGKRGLCDLLGQLEDLEKVGKQVNLTNILDAYFTRHNSTAIKVSIYAAVLITLGLLGTIVGLILSIAGLDKIINNVGLSRTDMLAGLRATIQGMGIAFYTTFFGAIFGGVILRILSGNLTGSLTELCAAVSEFTELVVLPKLHKSALQTTLENIKELDIRWEALGSSITKMANQMDSLTRNLTESLSHFIENVNKAEDEVSNFNATLLDSRLARIADQLNQCASSINILCGRAKQSKSSTDNKEKENNNEV